MPDTSIVVFDDGVEVEVSGRPAEIRSSLKRDQQVYDAQRNVIYINPDKVLYVKLYA